MCYLAQNTTLQGGKYRIERVLGQGGFGITYLARNTMFDADVAIKEFFMKDENVREGKQVTIPNAIKTELFLGQKEKFKKEAIRMFAFKNKHVVTVHDLFEENGTTYYVMNYIDGESLSEKLKRVGRPLSENEVRNILKQVLEALGEAHQNNIWHLDLKPGNILVDKHGNAYLIDFGASKQVHSNGNMTTSTALCYTPGYAPSEQIGQMYDRFGPWTDIYALGATVYNLLTNKKPPMAIDIEEDEEDAFDFPDGISEDMRKLVVWMMQPKRKKRPQSVDEILSKLSTTEEAQDLRQPEQHTEEMPSADSNSDDEETILVKRGIQQCDNIKAVDLGLSVLWADCNVGGDSESPIGGLYGWADPTGEKTSQNIADYVVLRKYLTGQIPNNITGTEYDIATSKWGNGWRMPSKDDWKELVENCKWTKEKAFHVYGYRVEGPNGNSIFLPNTGFRFAESISNTDAGYYWTSEMALNDRECAYYYYFNEDKINDIVTTRNYVYSGRAIRPVHDK